MGPLGLPGQAPGILCVGGEGGGGDCVLSEDGGLFGMGFVCV